MSQAFSSPRKRGLVGLVAMGLISALCLLLIPGAVDAAKGQDKATANVAKKKKKKQQQPVKVMTQNLYLGTDLNPIIQAANAGQPGVCTGSAGDCAAARLRAPDNFLNEVGFGLKDVQTNDFNVRARTIAKEIKKNKPDIVGLQEVALWKLSIPPVLGEPATTPLIDYSDTLLNALNKKAMSKKQCKKKGLKGTKCYRGYKQVTLQQEADAEQPGDFDNNPGPNGIGGQGPPFVQVPSPPFPSPIAPPCATHAPLNDASNPGNDDTGVSTIDPGPPNTTVKDPVTGQVVPFDWNGDSSSNTANGGLGGPGLNCGPDTFSGTFGSVPSGWVPGQYASDCPDNNPIGGMTPTGVPGVVSDPTDLTSTCALHGIDGEARLQMRDAIIIRKGAGVKIRNPQGGNYNQALEAPVGSLGTVKFTRGWTSVSATVRGRSFHFVDTQLESDSAAARNGQAAELLDLGAPGAVKNTVVVGDLNSDPSVDPASNPSGIAYSDDKAAYDQFVAHGYAPLTGSFNTDGHAEILNNPNDNTFTSRLDYILTNNPTSITMRSSKLLNTFANGLWGSDHGGVLSVLNVPQKKGKKKK